MCKKFQHYLLCLLFFTLWNLEATGRVEDEVFQQLRRDIVLLNLVNGLYLSTEQKESLVDKNEKAQQIRDDYLKNVKTRSDETERVLKEVKEVLSENQEIPKDLKTQFHQIKEILYRYEDEMGEKLLKLESEVEKLLTKNQLIVIDTFKPCIIPPAQGKIGQSVETASEGIVRMLSRIRRMSRDQYDLMKEMFVDFHIDKVERHLGIMDAEEKEQHRQEILAIFDKARKMSDKEFFLQKAELGKSLIPEHGKKQRKRKNKFGRVGHFLLDPALTPILKMRLEQG